MNSEVFLIVIGEDRDTLDKMKDRMNSISVVCILLDKNKGFSVTRQSHSFNNNFFWTASVSRRDGFQGKRMIYLVLLVIFLF